MAAPLFVLFGMTLSAQSPPAMLQIVRERIHPGGEQAYGRVEEELARLCRGRCPNRYLALASAGSPKEVWWLTMYDAQTDVDRVAKAYAADQELLDSMRKLALGRKGLTDDPVDVMTAFRRDLSEASSWRIGELRFAVVREIKPPAKSPGAVFELADGRAFVFAAASSIADATGIAAAWGTGAQVLEVRPEWSFPQDSWVARNPELWKR
jgi:hypothetical protein